MYEQCRNNGEKMMEHMIRAYEQPDATRLNQLYLSTAGFKTTMLFSYVNFSK
jgi:hypothetical protein